MKSWPIITNAVDHRLVCFWGIRERRAQRLSSFQKGRGPIKENSWFFSFSCYLRHLLFVVRSYHWGLFQTISSTWTLLVQCYHFPIRKKCCFQNHNLHHWQWKKAQRKHKQYKLIQCSIFTWNQIYKPLFMIATSNHASHLYDHSMCAMRAAPHPPSLPITLEK